MRRGLLVKNFELSFIIPCFLVFHLSELVNIKVLHKDYFNVSIQSSLNKANISGCLQFSLLN